VYRTLKIVKMVEYSL